MIKKTTGKVYERLLTGVRRRGADVLGRNLAEHAESDRGRVMFSAPFRRLQNKAQVFALETNSAVRSRLTHSLEVASIGRVVAQAAVRAFSSSDIDALGLKGRSPSFVTFVETACLLHDIGNPPFGHFGEIAISDWFHLNSINLSLSDIGGQSAEMWNMLYLDFTYFDGNPQGFRISTKLQPPDEGDLAGLNLTATTLAATLKYPWSSNRIVPDQTKAGYFHTESEVVDWVYSTLGMNGGVRHPLVYLMEAADDIAYCVSDIEDGIEKGLLSVKQFAEHLERLALPALEPALKEGDLDAKRIVDAVKVLSQPHWKVSGSGRERFAPMQDFRRPLVNFLANRAGKAFRERHTDILEKTGSALLKDPQSWPLLAALKEFSQTALYSSSIVRSREITAQAVLFGLLDAHLPLMLCTEGRFASILAGLQRDNDGRPIGCDRSLLSRISRKHLSVYHASVAEAKARFCRSEEAGKAKVMERICRMRMMVDHISGMTDEFALQSFQLIQGHHVNPHHH